MARYPALPPEIVERAPTAGLWPGQTDEEELGISYDELDRILLGIELQLEPEAIAQKAGVPLDHVAYVQKLVGSSVHKRKMPLVPKVGARTIGLDWRGEPSSFLERREELFPVRDIENDFGRGQSERLPEPPRSLQSDAHQVRAASSHEQHGLTERTADPQRSSEGARVIRGLQGLDPGEGEHGTEVPALTQDDAGPGDPMLREQRGEREQDEVCR